MYTSNKYIITQCMTGLKLFKFNELSFRVKAFSGGILKKKLTKSHESNFASVMYLYC